jgi:hypothetical protein
VKHRGAASPTVDPLRSRSGGFVCAVLLVMTFGAVLLLPARPSSAQDKSLEYAVKATYLYKFIPFIAWPGNIFVSPASPFDICIAGDTNFGILVSNAVAGQSVDRHAIAVRRVTTLAEEGSCQVLFIGGDDPTVMNASLGAVRGKPVLTVTDAAPRGEHGVVNFVLLDDRVRFEIDLGQAARNGIAISSKLLSLAATVQPAAPVRQP